MPRQIPFFRPSIDDEEIQSVVECLRSGWLTTGPKVLEFEQAFSKFLGGNVNAIAVNSATSALHLGLEALGIQEGDEVILPTWTFTATAEIVRYLGAIPIIVDVDKDTLCVTSEHIEPFITSKTKAIIPVHFAGRMCNMAEISGLAKKYNLKLLEDAAHALPASFNGMSVGNCGADASAFSFYANKTITTGEGGMLVTNSHEIAQRAKIMRLHGIDRDVFNRFTQIKASYFYDVVAPGYKYNLTDIAGALGVVQLKKANKFREARSELALRYNMLLSDLPLNLPIDSCDGTHSWHLYTVQLQDLTIPRDLFISELKALNVATSLHYRPLHKMTVWQPYCVNRTFPNADFVYERCFSLPLYVDLSHEDQDIVVTSIRQIFKKYG